MRKRGIFVFLVLFLFIIGCEERPAKITLDEVAKHIEEQLGKKLTGVYDTTPDKKVWAVATPSSRENYDGTVDVWEDLYMFFVKGKTIQDVFHTRMARWEFAESGETLYTPKDFETWQEHIEKVDFSPSARLLMILVRSRQGDVCADQVYTATLDGELDRVPIERSRVRMLRCFWKESGEIELMCMYPDVDSVDVLEFIPGAGKGGLREIADIPLLLEVMKQASESLDAKLLRACARKLKVDLGGLDPVWMRLRTADFRGIGAEDFALIFPGISPQGEGKILFYSRNGEELFRKSIFPLLDTVFVADWIADGGMELIAKSRGDGKGAWVIMGTRDGILGTLLEVPIGGGFEANLSLNKPNCVKIKWAYNGISGEDYLWWRATHWQLEEGPLVYTALEHRKIKFFLLPFFSQCKPDPLKLVESLYNTKWRDEEEREEIYFPSDSEIVWRSLITGEKWSSGFLWELDSLVLAEGAPMPVLYMRRRNEKIALVSQDGLEFFLMEREEQ